MRYITKLHLVNWHYIEFRTLDLSKGINFLTGETGAGKSTILDALQLVILGDLRGHYFNKAAEEYNEHFLYEYMGKLKRSFFEIFKRSVAFKPPASIEEFIQKFICDDTKIDVEDMVTPIRIYKKIEKEAEKVETQIKSLQVISDEYKKLEKLREDYKISRFIYDRSELELENIKATKLREGINDAKQFIERESNRLKDIENESKKLDENIDDLKNKIENSKEIVLRKEINELGNKISEFGVIQK